MAEKNRQYAALPWRHTGGGIEVLLISSRETRRWVIPKGWPIDDLSPAESAAREAFEEAGIGGQIGQKAIGSFDYEKRLRDGRTRPITVEVFPLEAMIQHTAWPEQGERTLLWTTREEAAQLVDEAELAALIRKLT